MARGGLYYSAEQVAELPAQWRGFLLDQRLLRTVAIKPERGLPDGPARERYRTAADKLTALAKQRPLDASEAADLGAIFVRLGEVDRALEILRDAQRRNLDDFRIHANLGTAWQLHGDLNQAAASLREAVRLAPASAKRAEEAHLQLVRFRARNRDAGLDDLFSVCFVGESGEYEPGKLADAERKKLPADAVAIVQQLALWLPHDPRLLWQLAELAAAHGDLRTANSLFEGCVVEFNLDVGDVRQRRIKVRAALDELIRNPLPEDPKKAHEEHVAGMKAKSRRPLRARIDQAPLPPIDPKGVNGLPWSVIGETTLDRQLRPTFAKHLTDLDGHEVEMEGYVQPLGEPAEELASFLLVEFPIGCWFCEMPDLASMVVVRLPEERTVRFGRGRFKVVGRLALNGTDPENFLYTIQDARVEAAE
jgi:hypothetical protein